MKWPVRWREWPVASREWSVDWRECQERSRKWPMQRLRHKHDSEGTYGIGWSGLRVGGSGLWVGGSGPWQGFDMIWHAEEAKLNRAGADCPNKDDFPHQNEQLLLQPQPRQLRPQRTVDLYRADNYCTLERLSVPQNSGPCVSVCLHACAGVSSHLCCVGVPSGPLNAPTTTARTHLLHNE
jgi:hypothetical protein